MKRLLEETCAKVSKRKRKKLAEKEYANLQKRYRNILTCGISELPVRPERPSGKRGRLAQSDAQNLWDRMYEHEYAVLRIVDAYFKGLVSLAVMCMQGLDNFQSRTVHDSIENALAIASCVYQTFLPELGQML